jgi:putative DNA primase/helicase
MKVSFPSLVKAGKPTASGVVFDTTDALQAVLVKLGLDLQPAQQLVGRPVKIRRIGAGIYAYIRRERADGQQLAGWIQESPQTWSRKVGEALEEPGDLGAMEFDFTQPPAELFHTAEGDAYATVPVYVDGKIHHMETYPIKSRAFERHYRGQYYDIHLEPLDSQDLQRAIDTYEATALFRGEKREVYLRVAPGPGIYHDHIYIDLGDEGWNCIRITPINIDIIPHPADVKFIRAAGMLPLTPPDFKQKAQDCKGDIELLKNIVNINAEDFPLLVLVMVSWLWKGPFVILLLEGAAGSGKTTTMKNARGVIDPNTLVARLLPHTIQELMLAASLSLLVTYDNLTSITEQQANAFCVLATGGGLAARGFYQQAVEHRWEAIRPMILTAIANLTTRGDFLQRCVLLPVPPLPIHQSAQQIILQQSLDNPRILRAFCRAAQHGLNCISDIEGIPLAQHYRMIDFVRWCQACEEGFGFEAGTFEKLYKRNMERVSGAAASSPIAQAITRLELPFSGTATELGKALEAVGCDASEWSNARVLSCKVQTLEDCIPGIKITHDAKRTIRINKAA